MIKSCRGYANGSRVPGKYKVFDDNMSLYEVFCNFYTNSTMAWTLIQSYQLKHNSQFKEYSLADDRPVHQDAPVRDSYRLSKSRMKSIQEDSSKWGITCRYDTDGLNYTDYVRGSNKKVDVLTYYETGCQDVEFIDVRGYQCTGCNASIVQLPFVILHVNSDFSCNYCSFKPMKF